MKISPRIARKLLLPCLLALSTFALAPNGLCDAAARARYHDERARNYYERGDFDEAVQEFLLSEQIASNPRTAFNIALCFERLKRSAEAYSYFTEYSLSSDSDESRRTYSRQALEAISKKVARIEISSNPPGARIFVDKKEHGDYGITPRTIAVSSGPHRIWVELPGYHLAEQSVQSSLGQAQSVNLDLSQVVGTASITSSVRGQLVVRNAAGEPVAQGIPPLRQTLPPGSYALAFEAPAYTPWRSLLEVRADSTTDVNIEPVRLPLPTADLTVTSNTPGALIRLDNQPAGFSPMVLSTVPIGPHRVSIESHGKSPWSGDLLVNPNERIWVTASLEDPSYKRSSIFTWITGGVGAASLASGLIVGGYALSTHNDFNNAETAPNRADIRDRGQRLNLAASTLIITGIVALSTSAVLYLTTSGDTGRPSSANITRNPR
jgi:hypothetical protein